MATHSIGLVIDITKGAHDNTEIFNGKLRLRKTGEDYTSTNVYVNSGFWLSEKIDLVDKYNSLENLAISSIVNGSSTYKAFTRTSDDSITWDNYVEINYINGKMMSVPKRFIQIRIEFIGGKQTKTDTVHDFDGGKSALFVNNKFIKLDGNLQLRKEYSDNMTLDTTWSDTGFLFRKKISRTDFKKVNSISII